MTTYLVTGANRGIGRALLEHYVAKPNVTAIAAVRDIAVATPSLEKTTKGSGSKIITVKIDASSSTDAQEAVKELHEKHGVNEVDVVISSAGIARLVSMDELNTSDLQEHTTINAFSVLSLFQATKPLLEKASSPKFLFVTASAGSLTDMYKYPFPNGAYSATKAMANSIVKKIALENEWLIALMVHPGWVQTDLGNGGAQSVGMKEAPVPLSECTKNLADMIDNATKQDSGQFYDMIRGNVHAW